MQKAEKDDPINSKSVSLTLSQAKIKTERQKAQTTKPGVK